MESTWTTRDGREDEVAMRRYDEVTDVIRRHWDGRASTFDEGVGHGLVTDEQRRAWLEVLSRFAVEPPQRVLDVGCGTGFLALRFAELGHTVTGIDLSRRMVERARRRAQQEGHQIEFRVGDAAALDCSGETYDVVAARHVIWVLPDPERGLAEWLRVLRPGGRLVLIEGEWADNDAWAPDDAHSAPRGLRGVIETAAWSVLRRCRWYPRKLVNRRYWRTERELPLFGGAPATRLADLLKVHGVCDVSVEPLMDPMLWGGPPKFFRYLAVGTRASASQPV